VVIRMSSLMCPPSKGSRGVSRLRLQYTARAATLRTVRAVEVAESGVTTLGASSAEYLVHGLPAPRAPRFHLTHRNGQNDVHVRHRTALPDLHS